MFSWARWLFVDLFGSVRKVKAIDGGCEISFSTDADFKLLTPDKVNYLLDECRLHLGNVSENTARLSNKGLVFLGLVSGIIGAILTFVISDIDRISFHPYVLIPLAVYFYFLWRAFYILFKFVLPINYFPIGTQPKTLLRKEILEFDFDDIVIKQLKLYQERIDGNIIKNNGKAICINQSLRLIIIYPVVTLVIFLAIILIF